MVEADGELIFYANACRAEHGGPHSFISKTADVMNKVIIGRMKEDRFVCIDSGKGIAEMTTHYLKLKKPDLLLNISAPFGRVKAQIFDGNGVIDGYSYEDCDPIQGDHTRLPLSWRGKDLTPIYQKGEWIKLQISFEQAEIYSITGDFVFTINKKAPIYERL